MTDNIERKCGGCTACCLTHAVFAIGKPPGKWCEQCEPGQGCRVYLARPEGCREFKCEWLKGGLSEEWYPPHCGVVLDFVVSPEPAVGELLQVWEAAAGSIRLADPAIREQITGWRSHFSVCLLFLAGKQVLLLKSSQSKNR